MDTVFEFLNQPIILAILSLLIGGYLFGLISDRRSRKDKIRDESIKFINEVSLEINEVLGHLYRQFNSGNLEVHDELSKISNGILMKRFSVRIRSKAYLKSDDFWRKYEQIAFEIIALVRLMSEIKDESDPVQVIGHIKGQKTKLAGSWPIEKTTLDEEDPNALVRELRTWTNMIRERAITLLESGLKEGLQ